MPSSGKLFALAKPKMSKPATRGVPSLAAAVSTADFEKPPKGVDLNLNQFSLDAHDAEGTCISEPQSKESCKDRADAFWTSVNGEADSEYWKMFKDVFNPSLSDRHAEGASFSPPDTNAAYMNKLHSLVKQEDEIRQKRHEHFFSIAFDDDAPGAFFPSSWASCMAIEGSNSNRSGILQARKEYAVKTDEIIKAGPPVFHKKTEDGIAWRIYRVGSLEVRTIQESNGEETVGAVFSMRDRTHTKAASSVPGQEGIVKVTEYVERLQKANPNSRKPEHQYYVTFETETGHTIVSEQVKDNSTWEENCADLVDRNSLAKVVRTAKCEAGITVQMLKNSCSQSLAQQSNLGDRHRSRTYATNMFVASLGGMTQALKAIEKHRVAIEAGDLVVDDLEKKLNDHTELSPCSQCGQSLTSGFKDAGNRWYCSSCWKREQYYM
jgi:hypothetical protein